jgi:PncC family amidohydrolase
MAIDPATTSPSMQQSPEERLFALLGTEGQLLISTAESCTGGNIAARITSVAGSSLYMQGGIVSYSNSSKQHLLGVDPEILASVGAVSPECARAMAEGTRRAYGSDGAVATTGIAGPGGATARKPVGLVYIARSIGDETLVEEHHFPGDRREITAAATNRALEWLVSGVEHALASSQRD